MIFFPIFLDSEGEWKPPVLRSRVFLEVICIGFALEILLRYYNIEGYTVI